MFTEEQIKVLATLADRIVAENQEIVDRNKAIEKHTASLEDLNKEVEKLAEKHGIDLGAFQVQSQVHELNEEEKNFEEFRAEVAALAKEQGLDDFNVKKVE